jgi:hypothetical protein
MFIFRAGLYRPFGGFQYLAGAKSPSAWDMVAMQEPYHRPGKHV